MQKEHYHNHTDRYLYDFNLCTTKKGYAQVDTQQDASYYGTWANPFERKVVSYCEGDVYINTAENDAEFVAEIESIKTWNDEQGWKFYGIDPGFNQELKDKFIELGLQKYLH